MTISVMPDILTNILADEPIAPEKIEYLRARVKLRLHDLLLQRFAAAEDSPDKLDQAKIARRLGVTRARISQQLGVPGNWTIDSVTKLAAAIGGEIDFRWVPFPRAAAEDGVANLANIITGQSRATPQPPAQTGQKANSSSIFR